MNDSSSEKHLGIINLWDLSEKEVCLSLLEPYTTKFLDTAKKEAGGGWCLLAKELGLRISKYKEPRFLRTFYRNKITNLFLIKKISDFLVSKGYNEFSLKNLQKNISLIKAGNGNPIYNPKFPINFNSKEGAILMATMFHDGGITTRDSTPFYANTVKSMRLRFIRSIKTLIGELDFYDRKNNKETDTNKILGFIFIALGLKPGKRQINNPNFPKFIFNYNEELILEFLAQAIADDGWVYCPEKGYGFIGFNFTIDLTKYNKEFRQRIKEEKLFAYIPKVVLGDVELFKKLGILIEGPYFSNEKYYYKNEIEKRYTQEWRFHIRDLWGLKFLAKNIKIPLDYKQKRLEKIANRERKVIRCSPKLLKFISKLDKYFTTRELLDLSKFNEKTLRYQLDLFCEDGFLEKRNAIISKDSKFEYDLTEKGLEKLKLLNN